MSAGVAAAAALACPRTGWALPALYGDSNNSTAGGGGATRGGTWGVNNFWSTSAAGTAATGAFVSGNAAVFSAGSDATGNFTVAISGLQSVGGVIFEEGAVTLLAPGGAGLNLVNATQIDATAATAAI